MFDTLRDNSRIIVYIVVVAFVISGGFMGYGAYLNNQGGGQNPNQRTGVIAEVNGREISQQEYFSLLQQQAPQSNLNSSQIIPFRYNVLNTLIERKLVLAEAEKLEIKVEISEAEIDENYNNILEQNDLNDQELADNLAEQGYTIGELREDIKASLKNNKLITKTINNGIGEVEVNEEEIKNLYAQRYPASESKSKDSSLDSDLEAETPIKEENNEDSTSSETRPPLEEVRTELETELQNRKRNQAANNWINKLKSAAEITINEPVLSAYHALEKENYDSAVTQFKSFVDSEQTDPIFYNYLAQAYEGKNNYKKAEEVYEKAIAKYPENTNLKFNYTRYLIDQDQKELAVSQLDEISALAGDEFMTYYQLFMLYNQLGEEEKAQAAMEKIQKISQERQNPSDSTDKENMDTVQEEVEDLKEDVEVESDLETENN